MEQYRITWTVRGVNILETVKIFAEKKAEEENLS